MDDPDSSVESGLFGFFDILFGNGSAPALLVESSHFRIGLKKPGQRVVKGNRGKTRAEQGVRASREDLQVLESDRCIDGLETKLEARAPADPVSLHEPHLFGPVDEFVDRFKQFLRKVGNTKKPLGEFPAFNQGSERQPRPFSTCSFARTVSSTGSQFTVALLR